MDRAGKLIRNLHLPAGCLTAEDLARAAWPQAVGKRIAERTRPVGFVDGFLIVEVTDAVWQQQLESLRGQILPRLREIAGPENVRGVQFRRGVPRRGPGRAERVSGDEADQIDDPVLRKVYIASRKRSLA